MPPRPKPGALAFGSNPVPSSITRRRSGSHDSSMCTRVAFPWRAFVTASPRIRASASLTSGPAWAEPEVENVTLTPVRAAITAAWRASTRSSGSSTARRRCSIAQRESSSARSAATSDVLGVRLAGEPDGAAADERELLRDAVVQVARDPPALALGRARGDGRPHLEDGRPQQHERRTAAAARRRRAPTLGDRREQRVWSLAKAKSSDASPSRRANTSSERTPRSVRPTAASANPTAPASWSARAASGWLSSRPGDVEGDRRDRILRERERRRARPTATAPTVIPIIDSTAVRGVRTGRAGANAPAPSSADPTNVPVIAIRARGPCPGVNVSIVVSTANVTAISARPAAMMSRSSRRPSRQPRTTIAVASSAITATPVSSATRRDGAG